MRCFPCMQSAGRQRPATQTPLKKDKCTFHGVPTHTECTTTRNTNIVCVCESTVSTGELCASHENSREYRMHNALQFAQSGSQQSAEIVRQLVAAKSKELARTHFPVYSCLMYHTCTHTVAEAPILATIYMINMCGHTVHFAADYIHSLTCTCETKFEYVYTYGNSFTHLHTYHASSLWKR